MAALNIVSRQNINYINLRYYLLLIKANKVTAILVVNLLLTTTAVYGLVGGKVKFIYLQSEANCSGDT